MNRLKKVGVQTIFLCWRAVKSHNIYINGTSSPLYQEKTGERFCANLKRGLNICGCPDPHVVTPLIELLLNMSIWGWLTTAWSQGSSSVGWPVQSPRPASSCSGRRYFSPFPCGSGARSTSGYVGSSRSASPRKNNQHPSLWPSGIGAHLVRNKWRVWVLAASETYPMFIEPYTNYSGPFGVLLVHMVWYKNCVHSNHPRKQFTHSLNQWRHLAYSAAEINSIQLHDSFVMAPLENISVHYTLSTIYTMYP